jgi:Domain of Unknown Function (DUF1543)
VVVAERSVFVEDAVAFGLGDRRGRAVEEGAGVPVVLHEEGQAAAVGRQVPLPVVRLGHREVEDVLGILGQSAHVARLEVDWDALDAGHLQLGAGGRIGEPGRPDDPVVAGQGSRQRARHLPRDTGDDDGTSLQFVWTHTPFRARYAAGVHLFAAFLGGELSGGRMGEDHEVVFVVAEDTESARRAAKAKWGGDGRAHVDALTRLDVIDGFAVGLEPCGNGDPTETTGYN